MCMGIQLSMFSADIRMQVHITYCAILFSSPCYCISWFWHSAESVSVGYVCVVGFFISSAMCIVARVWCGLYGIHSRCVALVFTVSMGVLACVSECLHALVHKVVL